MTITGTIYLRSETGTIRSIRYNRTQKEKVLTFDKGNESFNFDGAMERAKQDKSRWEASDQFIGRRLSIEVE